MKSIPSLVAASTVGAAATGLVFGRPQDSIPTRPTSNKRKAADYDGDRQMSSSPLRRPATSSTMTTPPDEMFTSSPITTSNHDSSGARINTVATHDVNRAGSRVSTAWQKDGASAQDGVERRASGSSRSSWMRRLSTMQLTQHESPRSSVGPDSPSLTFSHTSAAPMPPSTGSPELVQPNKLVKRSTSGRMLNGDLSRSGSRSKVPTLRRPATSHQRSATLQQQYRNDELVAVGTPTLRQSSLPAKISRSIPPDQLSPIAHGESWNLYFESRPTKLMKDRPLSKSTDGIVDTFHPVHRRVVLPGRSTPPTLMKASMLNSSKRAEITDEHMVDDAIDFDSDSGLPQSHEVILAGPNQDSESYKRVRRSLSMRLSSPVSWIPRSRSLRASKSVVKDENMGKRYSSAPAPSSNGRAAISSNNGSDYRRRDMIDLTTYENQLPDNSGHDLAHYHISATEPLSSTTGTDSSQLPTLSRLSSLNTDLSRMALSSSSSSAPQRTPTPPILNNNSSLFLATPNGRSITKPSPVVVLHQQRVPRSRDISTSDRGSTLIGSDTDTRGFASGDDDEIDFQSDTVYDSYRTGATGSMRARNTTLELMFDESPPSSGTRSKSPGFHDLGMMTTYRDTSNRILEEDEGMTTPIKSRRRSDEGVFSTPVRRSVESPADAAIRSSPPNFSLASREFGRLSLEDEDEDEDWTRDDDSEVISNPLSPPSSSINSHRVSPSVLNALADFAKDGSPTGNASLGSDRPRSVFDWSEPLALEKMDIMGNSPRPKTAYGKQTLDGRVGRSIGRRGPSALLVRSQSVPAVPDVAGHREHANLAPKFGTWGLGAKGVSEDWDNDFEFENMDTDEIDGGENSMSASAMLVPPAIQASQASVVGHVGHIREVCLLVEDLKRLRSLARERGILNGPTSGLWREADGIIALAIPDEDDATLSPTHSPLSAVFDGETAAEKHRLRGRSVDEVSQANFPDDPTAEWELLNGNTRDSFQARRRSVFSPEDDIFGSGGVPGYDSLGNNLSTPMRNSRHATGKDSTDVARSVMEHIHQHRTTSDPVLAQVAHETPSKMPFDTTSLRDLVHRASNLSRILAEIIRKAEGTLQSPNRSPNLERDSSPAFTRVFTDPLSSPPKHLPRSHSNNSVLSGPIDASPTRGLGQRMHLMTVV